MQNSMINLMLLLIFGAFGVFKEGNALSQELRKYFINSHNDYRSQLALGQIKNKNGSFLPQGSNIYQLRYSLEVEKIAQDWANNCVIEHAIINDTTNNLFAESPYKPFATISKTSVDAWLNEINENGLSNLNFTAEVYDKDVAHWVEFNWHDVREIGCGIKDCPNGLGSEAPSGHWTFVVCAYNPGGNYLNEYIYTPGTPCSNCNSYPNSKCNQTSGLCYIEEPIHSTTIIPTELPSSTSSTPLVSSTPLQKTTALILTTLTTISSTFTWSYSTFFDSESNSTDDITEDPTTKNTTIRIKTETTRAHRIPHSTPKGSTSSKLPKLLTLSLLALIPHFSFF